MIRAVSNFFEGWRFPAFMLSALAFLSASFLAVLLVPGGEGTLAAFAEDFKVWCFRYDPESGELEWTIVIMMVLNPMMLAAILLGVWWVPLKEAIRERRRAVMTTAATALFLAVGSFSALILYSASQRQTEFPFPAESLRLSLSPPDLELINQDEELLDLESLRGQVVLMTAVYASCGYTCPMIMGQTKRVVGRLTPKQRESLTVIGVSLDPENDTTEVLSAMAAAQGIEAPLYNLMTGDVIEVNRVLDQMGVSRKKDAETGVIDHANIFLLVDRAGRVAYRLTLGDLQEEWLLAALEILIAEGTELAQR